ncbi:hypothetical protein EJ08DRAFT_648540 [Tothia fuscella]|uniref:Uncharacterized protein n=1 Tax=Tothia fuscella TaxID=1048955 RepID=A0A9P4U0G0_9PEZI|nr:hypothetical protein EJ08DRAFT_648540 [Tothia fuscella]
MADIDMDVDMDIDYTYDAVPAEGQEGYDIPQQQHQDTSTQMQESNQYSETTQYDSATQFNQSTHLDQPARPPAIVGLDGTVAQDAEPIPEKVHLRGVDNLDTSSVKQFAESHYSLENFIKVEWVDDTSVNLVYSTKEAADEALTAFTDTEKHINSYSMHPLEIRSAKAFSTASKPDEIVQLKVRQATTGDVKKKGARDYSRFYLLNPDKDPREARDRDFQQQRRQQRPRRRSDENGNGDYNRRRFDDREHKRRRQDDTFDASMYDEDSHSHATSADDQDRRKRVRFGQRDGDDDLFGGRNTGRLRDRSASPLRNGDGDGRYGFGGDETLDDSAIRRKIRQRSQTPPRHPSAGRASTNIYAINNSGKELFAKPESRMTALAPSPAFTKELFPHIAAAVASSSSPKELFPNKKVSHHRRSFAIDESPERYNSSATNKSHSDNRTRSLADRITGNNPQTYNHPLTNSSSNTSEDLRIRGAGPGINIRGTAGSSLSIKGAASSRGAGEFNVRGAAGNSNAADVDVDGRRREVKELFPMKAGNIGKELFAEKLQGRGGPRRAADSFF